MDPLPGRHFEYEYDSIGNRKWSGRTGVSVNRDDYTRNNLNQYTHRENNSLAVAGTADTNANVLVDENTELAPRAGRYFSDQYWPDNGSGPWRGTVNVFAAKPGLGSGGAAKPSVSGNGITDTR